MRRAAVVVGMLLVAGTARAEGPAPRWTIEGIGSVIAPEHVAFSDTGSTGHQGLVAVGGRLTADRIRNFTFGFALLIGASLSAEDSSLPAFTQLEAGLELGVDDRSRTGGLGVGLRVRPTLTIYAVHGEHVLVGTHGSTFVGVPQVAALVGSTEFWVTLAAGGEPHALDSRVGLVAFDWAGPPLDGELGFAVFGAPLVTPGEADVESFGVGVTARFVFALSTTLGLELAAEIGLDGDSFDAVHAGLRYRPAH